MRPPRSACAGFALAIGVAAAEIAGASDAVQRVAVRADVQSKSVLRVSSERLTFHVPAGGETATATLEYQAAVRTRSGGEIVLAVEAPAAEGPGGSPGAETTLTFRADSGAGRVSWSGSAVAARWVGSGTRNGRITFSLRAPAAGTYHVPVRLVLAAP